MLSVGSIVLLRAVGGLCQGSFMNIIMLRVLLRASPLQVTACRSQLRSISRFVQQSQPDSTATRFSFCHALRLHLIDLRGRQRTGCPPALNGCMPPSLKSHHRLGPDQS